MSRIKEQLDAEYVDQPAGGTPSKQKRSDEKSPIIWKPNLISFGDIRPKPIHWLWRERFPSGCITTLVGRPGAGKSFLTCDMAAHISTGTDWPDGCSCSQGDIILISCEDDPHQVIRPRLDAHGAEVSRVHLLTTKSRYCEETGTVENLISLHDVELIEQTVKQLPNCKLIVIDPIGSYLGSGVDAHRDNDVRSVLAPIAKLAEKHDLSVVLIVHTRKGAAGHADDMALGSRAFVGISRAVWHVMQDSEDDKRKLMLPGKTNLSAQNSGLAYRIESDIEGESARVVWEEGLVEMSANDAMAQTDGDGEHTALNEAVEWLEIYLADGAKLGKQLKRDADSDGISKRTLERAKSKLKIASGPQGKAGPWMWSLPDIFKSSPSIPRVRQGDSVGEHLDSLANSWDSLPECTGEVF